MISVQYPRTSAWVVMTPLIAGIVFGIYSFAIKGPAYLSKQQIMWKSREWMSIFRERSFKICKRCFKISKK